MRRWHIAIALAMLALLLMPINYRAGAAVPHSHALIQLIIEARADVPVHHHGLDEISSDHRGGNIATSHTGAPPIQVMAVSALLPVMLLAFMLWTLRSTIRQISDARPADRAITPGHPPPEFASSSHGAP